ncbi:MAG: hypothetical protein HQL86_07815 [Magnetococcales bacterium]|nr:hypothetical protein [Magnetococcales bacterium]
MTESQVAEIIKAQEGGLACRRVGIQALLDAPREIKGEHFLRLRPDGRLPVVEPPKKEPEISAEELHARRLEQMEREVYQRVFAAAEAAGLKAGEERMEREIHALLPRLEGVLANLEQLHERILAGAERYLVETTLILIRDLIATELTVKPEIVAERVKRILKRAAGRKGIVIRVSPGNARILERIRSFGNLNIEADPSLSSGAVHLESDFGGLEDNLEMQLKEVELAMREYLQERLDAMEVPDIAGQAREVASDALAREPLPLTPDPGSMPGQRIRPPVAAASLAPVAGLAAGALAAQALSSEETRAREEAYAAEIRAREEAYAAEARAREEAFAEEAPVGEALSVEEAFAGASLSAEEAFAGEEALVGASLSAEEAFAGEEALAGEPSNGDAWELQGLDAWSGDELDPEDRVEELAIDEIFTEAT